METIRIKGLEIFAYHGVNPEEKENGQKFILDIAMQADISREIFVSFGICLHGFPSSPAVLNSINRKPIRNPAMITVSRRKLRIPHPKSRDPIQNKKIIHPLPRRKSASPVIT